MLGTLLVNAVHWALKLPTPGKIQKPSSQIKEARLPNLVTPDDLKLELVLREPQIGNPLYLNFDEHGRMWVVEYLQYPWPAGPRLASHDKVYRNVYDPPFAPPPPHDPASPFRGKDRISIHEDTDGNGTGDACNDEDLDGIYNYTAAFLVAGDYTISYSCQLDNNETDDDLDFEGTQNVSVVADTQTEADPIPLPQ